MSNKMKGVALNSSSYGSIEDAKARFRHQRLLQDYQEVKKETEMAKNKLEAMKQRKLTLLAEVRFLRQRHKHFLEIKAQNPPQEQKIFHGAILQTRHKSSTVENYSSKKKMKLQNKSSMLDLNMKQMSSKSKKHILNKKESNFSQKEKKIGGETFLRNANPGFDLNLKEKKFGAKEDSFKHPSEVLNWNKKEKFLMGKEINSQKKNLDIDLNQMERSYVVREEALQKAPVFDLNLKLGEEDDLNENLETSRFEEPKNSFIGGSEEQLNDLKVSICRNVENVPNHSGKRKISWQDPVALKV